MRNRLFFPSILIGTIALLNYQALNAQKTWNLSGNSNASASSKLGTTNSVPLRIFTNNAERIHIDVSGNVGIGTTNPADKLHVEGIGLFTQGISASNGGSLGITPEASASMARVLLMAFMPLAGTLAF